MGHERRQPEPDEPAGAPEWMVTFSDCMTLLLTFFVLLLSFSSFDEQVFHKLKVIFRGALPSVSPRTRNPKDAFLSRKQIQLPTVELSTGSESPTLAQGAEENLKEETESADFRSRKVFLIPSKKIFWGKGTVISFQGRRTLSTMASFLKEVPSRIVISENGLDTEEESKELGLLRAWSAMKYLTTKQGLDKKWFSISGTSTVAQESFKGGERDGRGPKAKRMLEITLLEGCIYN